MKLGAFELSWLQGGTFELDGGTMFGAVPKVLWSRKVQSEDNYVLYAAAPILLRTPEANIVIETGLGNKLGEKQKKIFRIRDDWDLPGSLARLGLERKDIDYVVLTHCDFDHAGGISMLEPDGSTALTFPDAVHLVQATEWEDAMNPNIRSENTYWNENFAELIASDRLKTIEGTYTIVKGVELRHTGGHTRGHQVVVMESKGQSAVHMSDLLPSPYHHNPLWVMAYDNFPMEVIELKQQYEDEFQAKNAWFTSYHDIKIRACRFGEKGAMVETVEEDFA